LTDYMNLILGMLSYEHGGVDGLSLNNKLLRILAAITR